MTATTFFIIFLNITLFKLHHFTVSTSRSTDSSESEIFRRHRAGIAPYEYLRARLRSIPLRGDALRIGYPRDVNPDNSTIKMSVENDTQSSQVVANTTEIYNDAPAFPDADNIKVFEENDATLQHPLSLILKPFLHKISGVINYLTHPNVALTPLYLLSMLKRKFVQHLRDKLGEYTGDTQEYPYPYRF